MKAERCPVCYGSGKYQTGADIGGTNPTVTTCHGCGGKGWVEVQSYEPVYPHYPGYPSGGYYDYNGVWHPYWYTYRSSYNQPAGYVDINGVWHSY